MTNDKLHEKHSIRAYWMSVLARAEVSVLLDYFKNHGGIPEYQIMKAAETGTVMLEARAGGSGQRYNTGEATVTRCVVRLGEYMGFSYALGRDKIHALHSALLDGLLQDPMYQKHILDVLVNPLSEQQKNLRNERSRRAAATKVEFFTLVRGDG